MNLPLPAGTFAPLCGGAIIVTGPTAAGKSRLAIEMATQIGAEIISLDSIAVYRGMDIGAAKPSRADRDSVPHHLIDVVDPDQDFSVATYLRMAHAAVDDIRRRGRVPMFVGGTPMYLRAILRGFDPGPPANPEFRAAVQADVDRHGAAALHDRLRQVDPVSSFRIHPTDVRRMTRALEVSYLTGIPISHRQVQHDCPADPPPRAAFTLAWDRATLHDRINARTTNIFDRGLIEETRQLLASWELSKTAAAAIGYRETIAYLHQGDSDTTSLETLQAEVAAHTRQMARRQETWFRSFAELVPIDMPQSLPDLISQLGL